MTNHHFFFFFFFILELSCHSGHTNLIGSTTGSFPFRKDRTSPQPSFKKKKKKKTQYRPHTHRKMFTTLLPPDNVLSPSQFAGNEEDADAAPRTERIITTTSRQRRHLLIPPLNFALVADDVYRSGHPLEINYPFLEHLSLKTIVYIGDRSDTDNAEYRAWALDHGITWLHFDAKSAKEPFIENDRKVIRNTLEIILDRRNLPVLVHSNKGKHRVGVLVGVMRTLIQGWSLATIFDEYIKFANGKGDADLEFIEMFDEPVEYDIRYAPSFLNIS